MTFGNDNARVTEINEKKNEKKSSFNVRLKWGIEINSSHWKTKQQQ